MRIARVPHRWDLTPTAAIAVQRRLADRISHDPPEAPIRFVAGLDAAFTPDGHHCVGGVVLWDRAERRVVEAHTATRRLRFPYIPGLLSFREAPALLAALRKLRRTPDALMCDGQGIAHPRRFGIACHVGVICGLPTLGCAKSRLTGRHGEPAHERGSVTPLEVGEETIGEVVRTRDGVRPVFVSVGHRMDRITARRTVLACLTRYRLPEPTRLADQLVAREKRALAG